GEVATFEPGAISNIVVNTLTGTNLVTVQQTAANIPVTITDGGNDLVDIGNAGSAQGINEAVMIDNPAHLTKLIVNNWADTVGKNAAITISQITGLAPASIHYTGSQLSSLTINGGHGNNTYEVLSTPLGLFVEHGVPVTLNLAPVF